MITDRETAAGDLAMSAYNSNDGDPYPFLLKCALWFLVLFLGVPYVLAYFFMRP